MDKKGLLVFNRSYINASILAHLEAFSCAFSRHNICLEPVNNLSIMLDNNGMQLIHGASVNEYSFCLFWDKDVLLAQALEGAGLRLYNNSKSIELCDDKRKTALSLNGQGISMPKTIFAPLVYNAHNERTEYVDYLIGELGLPMIAKEAEGSMGSGVYLVRDRFELLRLRRKLIKIPHLYQEFMSKSIGCDCRYYVVGGQIIGAVKRFNNLDFRSNIANGGEMTVMEVDTEYAAIAKKAACAVGITFGAVDFFSITDGEPVLCEINSNPFFLNYKALSGIDLAESIADYIQKTI